MARHVGIVAVFLVALTVSVLSCHHVPPEPASDALRTPEGLAQWEQEDGRLKEVLQQTYARYQREDGLEQLQDYERAVRAYVDHGFDLYRAYRGSRLAPSAELLSSLDRRTALLMDVADDYIRHGSVAMGEGIASDVIHEYSDVPVLAPAQRRAEAILLHYRYRQDY